MKNKTDRAKEKIPCTCPKGGMYEREDGSTYVCDKCDGSEWVESEDGCDCSHWEGEHCIWCKPDESKVSDMDKQIEKLANFIMNEIPGEPSESEGAVDTAIRLLKKKNLEHLEDVIKIQCSNGNWNYDPYMMGLANGLLLAEHLIKGKTGEVAFKDAPKKWLKDYPNLWTKLKWKVFPNSMVASSPSHGGNEKL